MRRQPGDLAAGGRRHRRAGDDPKRTAEAVGMIRRLHNAGSSSGYAPARTTPVQIAGSAENMDGLRLPLQGITQTVHVFTVDPHRFHTKLNQDLEN